MQAGFASIIFILFAKTENMRTTVRSAEARSVLQSRQRAEQELPCTLDGGNGHFFARGMDINQIGAEGNAVEPGKLTCKQAAFQSRVNGFDLRFLAGLPRACAGVR